MKTNDVKTAVVFGATGLVGSEVVKELLNRPEYAKVIAVVRKPFPLSHPSLEFFIISDFSKLSETALNLLADEYFCCIGTTIKAAGSKENFRHVDLNIPEQIALLAQKLAVPYMAVVSSIGANIKSSSFYLHTKGEMERSVQDIYRGNLKIVRPSLLVGNRKEYRFGENVAIIFMKLFGWTFVGPLRKYRGIPAKQVARAMIDHSSDLLKF
ncbi:MAG: putative nucleoside-diphosphate-sugar epimerase [uncultured bacterium]|nr:MAG: putative nucleoside-diphosphate-sugar epimerase [uncultured bacterium]HBY01355.1 oxidoreductase [Rikenellaceae bacterium]